MTTLVLIPFNGTDGATEAPSFTSELTNATAAVVGSLWNNLTNNDASSNHSPSYHAEDPYGYFDKGDYDSGYAGDSYTKSNYGDGYSYGKMSVAVLTLGLVIVVEAMLKRIDAFAAGKPFGLAVLEAVYRECKCCIAAATPA
jgi:hypothetical protein